MGVVLEVADLLGEGDDDTVAPKDLSFDAIIVEDGGDETSKETEGKEGKLKHSAIFKERVGQRNEPDLVDLICGRRFRKKRRNEVTAFSSPHGPETENDVELLEEGEEFRVEIFVEGCEDVFDLAVLKNSVFDPVVTEGDQRRHHSRKPLRIKDHKVFQIGLFVVEMDERADLSEELSGQGQLVSFNTTDLGPRLVFVPVGGLDFLGFEKIIEFDPAAVELHLVLVVLGLLGDFQHELRNSISSPAADKADALEETVRGVEVFLLEVGADVGEVGFCAERVISVGSDDEDDGLALLLAEGLDGLHPVFDAVVLWTGDVEDQHVHTVGRQEELVCWVKDLLASQVPSVELQL